MDEPVGETCQTGDRPKTDDWTVALGVDRVILVGPPWTRSRVIRTSEAVASQSLGLHALDCSNITPASVDVYGLKANTI
jgi:hypothetical protein